MGDMVFPRNLLLRLGITVQAFLLVHGDMGAAQDARELSAAELIVNYSSPMNRSQYREQLHHLVRTRHGEAFEAFRQVLLSPDDLPDYVIFPELLEAMLPYFTESEIVTVYREALLQAKSERVAAQLLTIGPMNKKWEWPLYEDVATRAHSEGMRAAGRRMLDAMAHSCDRFRDFVPSTAVGFLYRGMAYLREATRPRDPRPDSLRQSRADLDRSIALDPRLAEAYIQRARIGMKSQEYDTAIEDLTEAAQLEPQNAYVFELRAEAHVSLGHETEARSDRDMARRLKDDAKVRYLQSPQGLKDYMDRARVAITAFATSPLSDRAARTQDALAAYRNIIQYHPEYTNGLLERGISQILTGSPEGSLLDFTAYLTLAPDAPYAHYLRARVLAKLGREAEGTGDLQFWREHQVRPEPITPLKDLAVVPRTTRNMSGLDALALTQHKDAWKIPTYAQILLSTRSDTLAYDAAVQGLGQFDGAELQPVAKQIETAVALELDKRGSAMVLLGKIQSPSSIPYLLAAARYGKDVIPRTALHVLAQFPEEQAAPALQRLVLSLEDDRLAKQAATHLGQVDHDGSRSFYEKVILSATRRDQIRAARSLNAPSGSTLAILTLMEIVQDAGTERSLREAAGKVLTRNSSFAPWVEERLRAA